MEILKEGTLPYQLKAVGDCSYCGCEILVTISECYKERDSECWVVVCPTDGCYEHILIHEKDFVSNPASTV